VRKRGWRRIPSINQHYLLNAQAPIVCRIINAASVQH
jgi:hypothetical protein